jgi:hypothetical protein
LKQNQAAITSRNWRETLPLQRITPPFSLFCLFGGAGQFLPIPPRLYGPCISVVERLGKFRLDRRVPRGILNRIRLARVNAALRENIRIVLDLMTIGYEKLAPEDFFRLLEKGRVSLLVDIRELPLSQRRGFSKSALRAAVIAGGMKYEHIRELGCPRDIRHQYRKEEGDWEKYTRRFTAYLKTRQTALARLIAWMQIQRCCPDALRGGPQLLPPVLRRGACGCARRRYRAN